MMRLMFVLCVFLFVQCKPAQPKQESQSGQTAEANITDAEASGGDGNGNKNKEDGDGEEKEMSDAQFEEEFLKSDAVIVYDGNDKAGLQLTGGLAGLADVVKAAPKNASKKVDDLMENFKNKKFFGKKADVKGQGSIVTKQSLKSHFEKKFGKDNGYTIIGDKIPFTINTKEGKTFAEIGEKNVITLKKTLEKKDAELLDALIPSNVKNVSLTLAGDITDNDKKILKKLFSFKEENGKIIAVTKDAKKRKMIDGVVFGVAGAAVLGEAVVLGLVLTDIIEIRNYNHCRLTAENKAEREKCEKPHHFILK